MCPEKEIDYLIEAGWKGNDDDFDPVAFRPWRNRCIGYFSALLGFDHIYTRFFMDRLQGASRNNLVMGVGIQVVVNHESKKTRREGESDRKFGRLDSHSQVHLKRSKGRRKGSGIN